MPGQSAIFPRLLRRVSPLSSLSGMLTRTRSVPRGSVSTKQQHKKQRTEPSLETESKPKVASPVVPTVAASKSGSPEAGKKADGSPTIGAKRKDRDEVRNGRPVGGVRASCVPRMCQEDQDAGNDADEDAGDAEEEEAEEEDQEPVSGAMDAFVAAPVVGKKMKKKLVEKTYMDDKGYLVTENVWEEVTDDEADKPPPVPKKTSPKKPPAAKGECWKPLPDSPAAISVAQFRTRRERQASSGKQQEAEEETGWRRPGEHALLLRQKMSQVSGEGCCGRQVEEEQRTSEYASAKSEEKVQRVAPCQVKSLWSLVPYPVPVPGVYLAGCSARSSLSLPLHAPR